MSIGGWFNRNRNTVGLALNVVGDVLPVTKVAATAYDYRNNLVDSKNAGKAAEAKQKVVAADKKKAVEAANVVPTLIDKLKAGNSPVIIAAAVATIAVFFVFETHRK